jgi:hypothetical protein
MDTGATNYMSGSRAAFIKLNTYVQGTVRFGDDSMARIEGREKVEFVCKNDEKQTFEGVYYIPQLMTNIVSVGQLDEDGYKVLIGRGVLTIREPGGRLLARVKRTAGRLYLLEVNVSVATCSVARGDEAAWRWHERLGHLNFQAMKKMVREELVRGLPDFGSVEQPCGACLAGKQRRASFPVQAQYHAERLLELVHGDLCGNISPPTPAGNQYFLLVVDDVVSIVLLPMKDRAPEAIKSFQLRAEAETRQKLGGLRTDHGGEFNSASFLEY